MLPGGGGGNKDKLGILEGIFSMTSVDSQPSFTSKPYTHTCTATYKKHNIYISYCIVHSNKVRNLPKATLATSWTKVLAVLDRWSYYAGSTECKKGHLGAQEVATIGRWLPYTGGH